MIVMQDNQWPVGGWRHEVENHAAILSRGMPYYRQWRQAMDEVHWDLPEELDPREWFDVHNQGSQGSCFPAGTKVTMADGSLKSIEAVALGDAVVTHRSESQRVLANMSRLYTGGMYRVTVEDGTQLEMTEDHVVLSYGPGWRNWERAGRLKKDQFLVRWSNKDLSDELSVVDEGRLLGITDITVDAVQDLPVYDITVEADHSFVAQGLVVHNCQGQSLADTTEYAHYIATGEEVQLSRGFAYLRSQELDGNLIGRDQGSTLEGGTRAAAKGLPLEDRFPYTEGYTTLLNRYRSQKTEILSDPSQLYKLEGAVPLTTEPDCRDFLRSWSGIIHIGIMWGLPNQWEITRFQSGGGGHAVSLAGLLKVAKWTPYGYGYLLKNSWGPSWGRNGWALVHPQAVEQMLSARWSVFIGRSKAVSPKPQVAVDI